MKPTRPTPDAPGGGVRSRSWEGPQDPTNCRRLTTPSLETRTGSRGSPGIGEGRRRSRRREMAPFGHAKDAEPAGKRPRTDSPNMDGKTLSRTGVAVGTLPVIALFAA